MFPSDVPIAFFRTTQRLLDSRSHPRTGDPNEVTTEITSETRIETTNEMWIEIMNEIPTEIMNEILTEIMNEIVIGIMNETMAEFIEETRRDHAMMTFVFARTEAKRQTGMVVVFSPWRQRLIPKALLEQLLIFHEKRCLLYCW
jgi:hypothetical protein